MMHTLSIYPLTSVGLQVAEFKCTEYQNGTETLHILYPNSKSAVALQCRLGAEMNLSPHQSAIFIRGPHMHPQRRAGLGPQLVHICRCSSLVTSQVVDTC